MTLAWFIFIRTEFLGYVFKLYFASLHSALVNISNHGLCIEKEKKMPAVISMAFWYSKRTCKVKNKKHPWKMYSRDIEAMEEISKEKQDINDNCKALVQ